MKASSGSEFANPEQLFNEIAAIAAIEHSLIVEYLLLHYVLRHDRPPTDSHPLAISSSEAAEFAFGLATREMRHFHGLNQALVSFGRPTQMGRSATIDSGFAATFAPILATSVIERIASRERELAEAVDERYSGLQEALRSPPMGAADWPRPRKTRLSGPQPRSSWRTHGIRLGAAVHPWGRPDRDTAGQPRCCRAWPARHQRSVVWPAASRRGCVVQSRGRVRRGVAR